MSLPLGQRCPYDECDGSGFVVDEETRRAQPCRCRPQRIAQAKARKLSAVIPKRYRGVSFDRPPVTLIDPQVVEVVRRYAGRLEENLDAGRGLWITGDVGTGKTTLAMLVSKIALDRGRTVAIYSLPRLLAEIRKTYEDSPDLSYLQLMDSLAAVDLLHIDDVGAERSNEWVIEQLYALINTRYEDQKAIVFTTNLGEEDLEQQITARTVSRLAEICGDPIPLFGSDKRREPEIPEHLQGGPRIVRAPEVYGEPPAARWR